MHAHLRSVLPADPNLTLINLRRKAVGRRIHTGGTRQHRFGGLLARDGHRHDQSEQPDLKSFEDACTHGRYVGEFSARHFSRPAKSGNLKPLSSPVNCEALDWTVLDRLRQGFLSGAAAKGPYWQSPADLAQYNLTYGERIGWKWDAVLRELTRRGWRPRSRTLLDWGCGSGVAGRRVLTAFGPENFDALHVWDHSAFARDFTITQGKAAFPALAVGPFADTGQPVGLLVISHVLNELPAEALQQLLGLIARAETVLWVEPGNHAVSRQLIGLRETLTSTFHLVAPCPHQGACGLLTVGNEHHWCHFFAEPPAGVQNDSDWVRFGQRAGVDLRSQAYSYLVLDRVESPSVDGASRILGRAEHFKGFARLLSCSADGVEELELQKRADADLFKQLKKDASHPLYRWEREDHRIVGAKRV
ncbi:MAG: hypothetical protein JF599_11190 [Verrucomicrobia bacterium]|nr:hypothetical protein [Verrucomicrobiota bacterium]